jgi:hypothetical protein
VARAVSRIGWASSKFVGLVVLNAFGAAFAETFFEEEAEGLSSRFSDGSMLAV